LVWADWGYRRGGKGTIRKRLIRILPFGHLGYGEDLGGSGKSVMREEKQDLFDVNFIINLALT
jgi:hypothetical protein